MRRFFQILYTQQIHEKIRMLGWEVLPHPLYSTNPWKDKNVRMRGSSTSSILKKSMKRKECQDERFFQILYTQQIHEKIRMFGWEVLPHPLYSTNPWKDMLGWEVLPHPLYSTNPWKDKNFRMGGSSTSSILSKSMKRYVRMGGSSTSSILSKSMKR